VQTHSVPQSVTPASAPLTQTNAPPRSTLWSLAQIVSRAADGKDAAAALDRSMHQAGIAISYTRRTEIVHEDDAADRLYKVVSGTVCTSRMLHDGRRQIGAFYLPGDVFGLECAQGHSLGAEAISDAKVLVIRKSALVPLICSDAAIANELLLLTSRELARVQNRILLLTKSAQERVTGFLLEMAERSSSTGNAIELPMSRQDIADYLGLTIETVSRTLWALESSAAIKISTSRRIVLRSRSVLRRLNG
jgi:CRP-like cAMP-binding protein